ncbi:MULTISPECIES: FIST N-terminal domain-containing protein [unclassified Nitratiruptor]|uniref:sensor domain-containing diguanylate cyclase n=1 Tax=unclassified Nitratiruptor TaxID=2624044 RepID=UPI0019168190|nr:MULTISPECIES: FIST N-terminal domain-containing protein [unclassified Nitratiruptor]BCD61020.1 hypothetical protein NitYY0810_C1801 [Nitratiruptor sp. YY08-10]BCD64952.1 c-di-GMP phosphodiesterase [Nitratiruptor sp. YY08-14]
MKSFNTVFHDEKQLRSFIKEKGIKNSNRLLVQVYSGIVHKVFMQNLLDLLVSLLPDATIVGSTTAGEIVDSKIYEKNVALSFTNMEHTFIKSDIVTYDQFSSDNPHYEGGMYFKKRLVTSDTKFILLLADGMRTNGEELVKGFGNETKVVIGGGLAGDYGQLQNTYVFCKNRVIENGAVAVAFDSKELQVFNYYTTGWKPIGRSFVVTKSTGNIVYELDGEPIYEIYERYLGKEIAKNLPDSAIEFPLMVEKDGKYIARAALAMNEDGTLVFAGNVPEGSCVRFGFGNTLLILDTAGKLFHNEMFQKRFESLFIFSCVARKRYLGDLVHEEIIPFKRVSPNIGFFTYGEFVTMKDGHELLNESLTLIAASEREESIQDLDLYNKEYVDDNSTIRAINALINLVEKTTQELEREKSELQSEVQKDGLTGLLNKKSLLNLLQTHLNKKNISLLLIDIDNFKKINDTKGHLFGDEVLKAFAQILIKNSRKSDIVGRFGGEEFVVVYFDLDEEMAKEKAERIRFEFEALSQRFGYPLSVSIGMTNKRDGDTLPTLLERADEALYFSKRNGKNRVSYL